MNRLIACLALLTVVTLGATLSAHPGEEDDLVTVPEPASLALLGVGAAGLVAHRIYSKRR